MKEQKKKIEERVWKGRGGGSESGGEGETPAQKRTRLPALSCLGSDFNDLRH